MVDFPLWSRTFSLTFWRNRFSLWDWTGPLFFRRSRLLLFHLKTLLWTQGFSCYWWLVINFYLFLSGLYVLFWLILSTCSLLGIKNIRLQILLSNFRLFLNIYSLLNKFLIKLRHDTRLFDWCFLLSLFLLFFWLLIQKFLS